MRLGLPLTRTVQQCTPLRSEPTEYLQTSDVHLVGNSMTTTESPANVAGRKRKIDLLGLSWLLQSVGLSTCYCRRPKSCCVDLAAGTSTGERLVAVPPRQRRTKSVVGLLPRN